MDLERNKRKLLRYAVAEHFRVVHSLMLRDIKTRIGASYIGFALGALFPLAHIGIVLSLYILMGRAAPIGTDATIYLASAIVPFVSWSYTHQKVLLAFGQNRALVAFPIVKFVDILIARGLVELLNVVIVILITISILSSIVHEAFIQNLPEMLYAVFLAYLYGVSTGFLIGIISLLSPAILVVGFLIIPLFWITCGIFFIPGALPERARDAISVFPLAHIVDFGRTALFSGYISDFFNLLYVQVVLIINVLIGLLIERNFRSMLK